MKAPALVASGAGWSRQEVLDWLIDRAREKADMIIGFDFSAAFPFADHGAYFPGNGDGPRHAKSLWRWIDERCADEPHLSASTLPSHPELAPHFRRSENGETLTRSQFEPGLGRLRATEIVCRAQKLGNAVSCFNLVGPAQVGKSSLTGMRLLHRLGGAIPVWPFDPVPESGPLIVEIYTGIAARCAGLSGATKLRAPEPLDSALERLGSAPHRPLDRYDDHSTDALLSAAWLRRAAAEKRLWQPPALTTDLARTEGWTFGVN